MTVNRAGHEPGVRAAIFDLDGTLADTLPTIAKAVNASLSAMGAAPRPRSEYPGFIGDGLAMLCRRVLEASGSSGRIGAAPSQESIDELRRRVLAHYEDHLLDGTRLYPGIDGLLRELRAAGVPMAVLSNKPHVLTERLVHSLLPEGTFQVVWGQTAGTPLKPDPAAALRAAAAMGVEPRACLFIGDSGVDMQTACAAGMVPVGVLWGFRGANELWREGAAHVVSSPKEIAALVLGPKPR